MTDEERLSAATIRKDELIAKFMQVSNSRGEAVQRAKLSQIELLNLRPLVNANMPEWFGQQLFELTVLGLLKLETK